MQSQFLYRVKKREGDRGEALKESISEPLNWDKLLAESARAGLAYSEFWNMTPCEWAAWMEGFALREEDAWKRTRTIYSILFNTNVEPHHRLKPQELIPLPSDEIEVPRVKTLNDEERAEIKRKLRIDG